eukprot:2373049-Pleurochrysis_carterae.AAC.3
MLSACVCKGRFQKKRAGQGATIMHGESSKGPTFPCSGVRQHARQAPAVSLLRARRNRGTDCEMTKAERSGADARFSRESCLEPTAATAVALFGRTLSLMRRKSRQNCGMSQRIWAQLVVELDEIERREVERDGSSKYVQEVLAGSLAASSTNRPCIAKRREFGHKCVGSLRSDVVRSYRLASRQLANIKATFLQRETHHCRSCENF